MQILTKFIFYGWGRAKMSGEQIRMNQKVSHFTAIPYTYLYLYFGLLKMLILLQTNFLCCLRIGRGFSHECSLLRVVKQIKIIIQVENAECGI